MPRSPSAATPTASRLFCAFEKWHGVPPMFGLRSLNSASELFREPGGNELARDSDAPIASKLAPTSEYPSEAPLSFFVYLMNFVVTSTS